MTGIRQRGGTYQVGLFDARSGDGKQVMLTDSAEAKEAATSSEIQCADGLCSSGWPTCAGVVVTAAFLLASASRRQ